MKPEDARQPEPVLMCWSGGKDCSLALQAVLQDAALGVEALLITVTEGYERVSMHGVRVELLERQAASIGLPLEQVRIPRECSNAIYDDAMRRVLARYQARGVSRCVFGDVFLQEVREYRERNLARIGMSGIFPLWSKDTRRLAEDFVAQGFRAIVVCVDPKQLDPSFCGREFDAQMLKDLPPGVDPCGENGEFHTFVYDGPIFEYPLEVVKGETVLRDGSKTRQGGFQFCDLLLPNDGC